jgi:hypothetical protein
VSHHQLTAQVSPKLFKAGEEIAEAEVKLYNTNNVEKPAIVGVL